MYRLDACSGTPLWQRETDHIRLGSPVIDENVLYVASHDGELVALDTATGVLLGGFSVGADVNRKRHPVETGTTYLVTSDRYLHAIDMGG